MRCPNCNCDVPEGSLFCPECGQKLEGVNGSQAENSGDTFSLFFKSEFGFIKIIILSC